MRFVVAFAIALGLTFTAQAEEKPEKDKVVFGVREGCVKPPPTYSSSFKRLCMYMEGRPDALCMYGLAAPIQDQVGTVWACVVRVAQPECEQPWAPIGMECKALAHDGNFAIDQEI